MKGHRHKTFFEIIFIVLLLSFSTQAHSQQEKEECLKVIETCVDNKETQAGILKVIQESQLDTSAIKERIDRMEPFMKSMWSKLQESNRNNFVMRGKLEAMGRSLELLLAKHEEKIEVKYLGCFVDGYDRLLKGSYSKHSDNSPSSCINKCKNEGFPHAGLQYGNQCYCGYEFPPGKKTSEADCTYTCPGDQNSMCGGYWLMNIYSTGLPKSQRNPFAMGGRSIGRSMELMLAKQKGRVKGKDLGCFNNEDRILNGSFAEISSNTPNACIDLCFEGGYAYAGVQSGSECHCGGNDLDPETRTFHTDCNQPCTGDNDIFCGGDKSMNIFSTGLLPCEPPFTMVDVVGCYAFIRKHATWQNAAADCESRQAQLYVAYSEYQFHTLRAHLQIISEFGGWVGAKSLKWNDGRPAGDTEWAENEPDGDPHECGLMKRDHEYKLVDFRCNFNAYYICQRI